MRIRLTIPVALTALWSACASAGDEVRSAATPPPIEGAGFYSAAQAARGQDAFVAACQECHSISEFRGRDFEWTWRRRTAWALFNEISSNMPEDSPGSLAPTTYADIVAYILQLNDYTAGAVDLAATREALDAVPLGPGAARTRGAR